MAAKRVLVVEDEEHLRNIEGCLLEESGYVVLEATTTIEGLDCLRDHAEEIELLVINANIQGAIDGLDLAAEVRRRWPWIRTVVTSGDIVEQLPPGAAFLSKPFAPLDLLIVAERTALSAR
jgi:DNA-binding response OmpR family regulator